MTGWVRGFWLAGPFMTRVPGTEMEGTGMMA